MPRRFQTYSERRGELTLEVFESSMANLFTTNAESAAFDKHLIVSRDPIEVEPSLKETVDRTDRHVKRHEN